MSTVTATTTTTPPPKSNNNNDFQRSRSGGSIPRNTHGLKGSGNTATGSPLHDSQYSFFHKSLSSLSNRSSSSSESSSNRTIRRPRRITMAGMIFDVSTSEFRMKLSLNSNKFFTHIFCLFSKANQSLERAMDPKTSGLHPKLFSQDLLGIGFYTVWEAGLIFSGNVGTGIVFARNPTNGSWSPPAAVGLSGIGWGLMGGASRKTIVYLIYDYFTLQSMSGENGAMLRAQAESSLGFWGRTAEASAIVSARGVGKNIALTYSRGIFGGISIEGAICKGRNRVNERFYGEKISTADILFSGYPRDIPEGTLLPEVYTKLERLCEGLSVYTPSPEEIMRVKTLRKKVNIEGEEALKEEVIEYAPTPFDYQQPAPEAILEESDSSEIEISENMDIFAELVDKEDAQHLKAVGLGVPPANGWAQLLTMEGMSEQTRQMMQNVNLPRLGSTSGYEKNERCGALIRINSMPKDASTKMPSDSAVSKMRAEAAANAD
jgi:lipid-binding SYLF domain-containing protein